MVSDNSVKVSVDEYGSHTFVGGTASAEFSALYTLTITSAPPDLPPVPGIGPAVLVVPLFSGLQNNSGYFTIISQASFCFPDYFFPGQLPASPYRWIPLDIPITGTLAMKAYIDGRGTAYAAFTGFQFYEYVTRPDGGYSYQPLSDVSYTFQLAETLPSVPEPACFVLTASGLAGLLIMRRRLTHG